MSVIKIIKFFTLVFILQFVAIQGKSQVFCKDSAVVYLSGMIDTLFYKDFGVDKNINFLIANKLYKKYLRLENKTKSQSLNEIQKQYCDVFRNISSDIRDCQEDLNYDTIILTNLTKEEKQLYYLVDESKSLYRQILWIDALISLKDLQTTGIDEDGHNAIFVFPKGCFLYPHPTLQNSYECSLIYLNDISEINRLAVWACLLQKRTYDMLAEPNDD